MEKLYDTIILGGGAAGLSAGIYSCRYGLKTLIITKEVGGTTNLAPEIENWPGFIGKGTELMKKFKEQAELFGAKIIIDEIKEIKKNNKGFYVKVSENSFEAKTLIICLGMEHRKLKIKGEEKFLGRGVSYCATCDGFFFRNKTVAVIGGANSAATSALYLSKIAKKVYIIYRKEKLRCESILLDRIKEKNNIEIINFAVPTELIGENTLQKIKILLKEKEEKEIEVNGVFVEIGAEPKTDLLKNLGIELNENGFIKTNKKMETSVPGIFAAGDITDNYFKQVLTAAAEGSIAANSAQNYLSKLK